MASQGPRYPGTVATQSVLPEDDNDWTTPGNVSADDGAEATITAATYDANDISFRLKAQNLGFTIPSGATIDGILVEIEKRDAAIGAAVDYRVQLFDAAGALVGTNKADTVTDWPTAATIVSYGGATDTWAASPTAAMVNDVDFGVALAVEATAANTDIFVDFIRITVYYTEGAVTHEGAAVLSATAAAAATGQMTANASAALAASATVAAVGTHEALGAAALAATAAVAAAAQMSRTGDALLPASADFAAAGQMTAQASAALSAEANLSPAAVVERLAIALLASDAQLSASGLLQINAAVQLAAAATVAANGLALRQAAAAMLASALLTADGTVVEVLIDVAGLSSLASRPVGVSILADRPEAS